MMTTEFPERMRPSFQSQNKTKQSSYFDHAATVFSHDRANSSLNDRFLAAAKNGDFERIQNFLARASKHISVNVDAKDKQSGNTAVLYAAMNKDKNMLSLLLNYGADITLCNNDGYSVLDLAPEALRPILLESVERKGASPRHLLQAAWQGNVQVLKRILDLEGAKFDINCRNADGCTPLLLVTRDVQLFEKIKKSVKEDGYKPLEVVAELLQRDVDCKAGDLEGRSVLHMLASDKSKKALSMTNLLIDKGDCHVDVPDSHRNSPLHFASREDNCPTVIALIKGGADVNIKGGSGRTPLHVAAHQGHSRVASTLLDHGADITLVDDFGYSPVDLAKGERVRVTLREAWAEKARKTASDIRCDSPGNTGIPQLTGSQERTPGTGIPQLTGSQEKTPGTGIPKLTGSQEKTPGTGIPQLTGSQEKTPGTGIPKLTGSQEKTPGTGIPQLTGSQEKTPGTGIPQLTGSQEKTPGTGIPKLTGSQEKTPGTGIPQLTGSQEKTPGTGIPQLTGRQEKTPGTGIPQLTGSQERTPGTGIPQLTGSQEKTPGTGIPKLTGSQEKTPGTGIPQLTGRQEKTPGTGIPQLTGRQEKTPGTGIPQLTGRQEKTPGTGIPQLTGRQEKTPGTGIPQLTGSQEKTPGTGIPQLTGSQKRTPEAYSEQSTTAVQHTAPPRAITPEVQVSSTSSQTAASPKKLRKRPSSAKPVFRRNSSCGRRPYGEQTERVSSSYKTPSTSAARTQAVASSTARQPRKTGVKAERPLVKLPTLSVLNVQFNYVKNKNGTSYWLGSHAARAPKPPHALTPQFSSPALLRRTFIVPPQTPNADPKCRSFSESTLPRSHPDELTKRRSLPARIMPIPGRRITSPELRSSHHNPLSCVGAVIDLDALRRDMNDSSGLPTPSLAFEKDTMPSPPPTSPINTETSEQDLTNEKSDDSDEESAAPPPPPSSSSSENLDLSPRDEEIESDVDLYSTQTLTSLPRSTFWIPYGGQNTDKETTALAENKSSQDKQKKDSSGSTFFIDVKNLEGLISGPGESCVKAKSGSKSPETAQSIHEVTKSPSSPSKGEKFWVPLNEKKGTELKEKGSFTDAKRTTTNYKVSCKCDEVTGICSCTVIKVDSTVALSTVDNSTDDVAETSPASEAAPSALPDEGYMSHSSVSSESSGDKSLAQKDSLQSSVAKSLDNKFDEIRSEEASLTKSDFVDDSTEDKGTVVQGSSAFLVSSKDEPMSSKANIKVVQDTLDDAKDEEVKAEACSCPNHDETTVSQTSPDRSTQENSDISSKKFQEIPQSDPSPSSPRQAWATPRGEERESSVVIVNSFPSPEPHTDRPTIQSPIVPLATNRPKVPKGKKGKTKGGKSKSGKGKSNDTKKVKNGKTSGKRKGKKSKESKEDGILKMISVKQETPDERGSMDSDIHQELDVPAPATLNSNKMLSSKLYRGKYLALSPILESPRSTLSTPREEKPELKDSSGETSMSGPERHSENAKESDEDRLSRPPDDEGAFDVVDGGIFSKFIGSCIPRLNLAATDSDSDTGAAEPLLEQEKLLEGRTSEKLASESMQRLDSNINQGIQVTNQGLNNDSETERKNIEKTPRVIATVEDEADDYIEGFLSDMINASSTHYQETHVQGKETHNSQDEFSESFLRVTFSENDEMPSDVTGPSRNPEAECTENGYFDSQISDTRSDSSEWSESGSSDQEESDSEFASTDEDSTVVPLSGTSCSSANSHFSLDSSFRSNTTPTFSDASLDIDFNTSVSEQTSPSDSQSSATLRSQASLWNSCNSRVTSSSFSTSSEEGLVRSRIGSSCRSQSVASQGEDIVWKKGNILGKGAFGQVWLGLTSTGEMIAVKQVELYSSDTKEVEEAEKQYEMLQEEVTLLKTLRHENVVRYIGTCLEGRVVNIFMEFVPGGSIASILARFGSLSESVFQRYTKQLVSGVAYLHRNNVIHRDIKGGNIMIMPTGVLKLIDFSCAKRLYINLSMSRSNILRSMKGSPYWMAPEVIMETGHGRKADIWGIGCTVFEMATGKPPWADMPPMPAIFAIGSGSPVPQLSEEFSEEARHFVSSCMTRDPDVRPSAIELQKHRFIEE